MSHRCYSRVAYFWAWVFLIVGCLFGLMPTQVGQNLSAWAHLLGLSGAIASPTGNLWHVLSLSLMAAITVCAFWSARHPEQPGVYYALLVAKSVSTIGFTVLAITQAPAWILCAGGDGFVGVTLWASHHYSYKGALKVRRDFARIYRGQAPFYEVWFGKLNIAPDLAFWFRYTLLDGAIQEASSWAILFHDGRIEAGKESTDIKQLSPGNRLLIPRSETSNRFGQHPQVFHMGDNYLDAANAIGRAGSLGWDLSFHDRGRRFDHVPKTLTCLGLAKSQLSSCYLDLHFSGSIEDGDDEICFNDVPGMIGHIHGKRHAHEWAWAHCNHFDDAEDVVFEGLSARLRIAGRMTRPLSSFVLYVGKTRYAFSSIWKLTAAESEFGTGQWRFRTHHQGVTLEGELRAPSHDIAIVTYTDTDNSRLWCHNSKLSELRLHLVDSHRQIDRTFVAARTAAFEIVNRVEPKGDVML